MHGCLHALQANNDNIPCLLLELFPTGRDGHVPVGIQHSLWSGKKEDIVYSCSDRRKPRIFKHSQTIIMVLFHCLAAPSPKPSLADALEYTDPI